MGASSIAMRVVRARRASSAPQSASMTMPTKPARDPVSTSANIIKRAKTIPMGRRNARASLSQTAAAMAHNSKVLS